MFVFWYRPQIRRRILCSRHNLSEGFPYYLTTVLVGWTGIGIFRYPFELYRTAMALGPLAEPYRWALTLIPTSIVAVMIVSFYVSNN